jgi:prepilin signal peptidase PulO-like enzyme (type II secretory pathway)
MTFSSLLLLFITGSCFGSFFYTLALRLSGTEYAGKAFHLFTDRSHCPHCKNRMEFFYLVPIAGYFLSRGRCRSCLRTISFTYPVAEIFSGFLLCFVIYFRGTSLLSVSEYFFLMTACAISVVDFRSMKIPDSLVILMLLLSIYPVFAANDWRSSLYGSFFLGGILLFIILVFPGGFGGGDIKFGAVIGFFLGLELSMISMEASLLTGSVVGLLYARISGKGLRIRIPFAPFLSAGLLIAYFWGREILALYYSKF